MRLLALSMVAIPVVTAVGVVTGAPASAAPCGVDLDAPQIRAAVQQLRPAPNGWRWNPDSAAGNYNPCATLSTAIVSIENAMGGSPRAAMLFHRGEYLGTATWDYYGRTVFNARRTTDDTVVLDYYLRPCSEPCPPGTVTTVRYQWQGDHVEMLDPAPPR